MKVVNITITNEIYKILHHFQQLVLFAYINTTTTTTTPHNLLIYHNYLATNVIQIITYNTIIFNSIYNKSAPTIWWSIPITTKINLFQEKKIAKHHTNYNTEICNNINTNTFTIQFIDHTQTNKCQCTPTSPTGTSIFSSNTINNRHQLHFQHLLYKVFNIVN